MKVIQCVQGGQDWIRARLGRPTASQFDKLVTPKTLKASKSADAFMHKLLAEWATGESSDDAASGFMDRGIEMESEAADWYAFTTNTEPVPVGFCTTDDGRAGCSPDRLVGDDGGLEIKCPSAKVHVGYLLGTPPTQYRLQIQGSLYVTGRQWWDWLSYHPDMPSVLIRMERDEECIDALSAVLPPFCDALDAAKRELYSKGVESEVDRWAREAAYEKAAHEELLRKTEAAMFGG
ncbi:MAG: lambda exonuclease family protein [Nannocystaceae bacterium]